MRRGPVSFVVFNFFSALFDVRGLIQGWEGSSAALPFRGTGRSGRMKIQNVIAHIIQEGERSWFRGLPPAVIQSESVFDLCGGLYYNGAMRVRSGLTESNRHMQASKENGCFPEESQWFRFGCVLQMSCEVGKKKFLVLWWEKKARLPRLKGEAELQDRKLFTEDHDSDKLLRLRGGVQEDERLVHAWEKGDAGTGVGRRVLAKRLRKAAEKGMVCEILSAIADGADPRSEDCGGFTPLHMAAERGKVEAATLLLEKVVFSVDFLPLVQKEVCLRCGA